MQWMTGIDASFLYAESARAPMHTLKVLELEPPRGVGDPRAWLRRGLERAVAALPALRVAPELGPLGLDRWIAARADLDAHVRFERLWPLGRRSVEDAIGELLSTPLRRDRPLWELLVIERPDRRALTLAFKLHHALADGLAAARMLEIVAGGAEEVSSERRPAARLAVVLSRVLALIPTLLSTERGLLRARRAPAPARAFGGEAWSLDRSVTSRRQVALVSLPFDAVRAVKHRAGVTVTDVILAITAGALRRHLARAGDGVAAPLVASVPVGAGGPRDRGNALSNLLVPLHVELEDAEARLAASAASARAAKAHHHALGPALLTRWSDVVPGVALWAAARLARLLPRSPVNAIVSSVPGPRAPLEIGGARLCALWSVGPLLETTGVNVTFWSYGDRLHACVLTSGVDPRPIADALHDALDELCWTPSRTSIAA